MTLEQLKELLSTYGVNDGERNAPVFVTINGEPVEIMGAEIDWTLDAGHALLLSVQS